MRTELLDEEVRKIMVDCMTEARKQLRMPEPEHGSLYHEYETAWLRIVQSVVRSHTRPPPASARG
jgi:hypothetical protein